MIPIAGLIGAAISWVIFSPFIKVKDEKEKLPPKNVVAKVDKVIEEKPPEAIDADPIVPVPDDTAVLKDAA